MHRSLPQHDRPEILEAELSGLVLDCASWGTPIEQLSFLDPPPAGTLATGRALLEMLVALDAGRLTALGRQMAGLGAHPRLAAMMLTAGDAGSAALAADLAALLEERDPLRGRDVPAGIDLRLDALAGAGDADRGAVARIRQQSQQYRRRLGTRDAPAGCPGTLLAAAFPDRIAQRRDPGSFRFSGGGGAKLPPRRCAVERTFPGRGGTGPQGRIRDPPCSAPRPCRSARTHRGSGDGDGRERFRQRDRLGPVAPASAAGRLDPGRSDPSSRPGRDGGYAGDGGPPHPRRPALDRRSQAMASQGRASTLDRA